MFSSKVLGGIRGGGDDTPDTHGKRVVKYCTPLI